MKRIRIYVLEMGVVKSFMGIMLVISILLAFAFPVAAESAAEPDTLYSRSCVLMDGTTGRILFEKNGHEIMPMASTTKIMTLIVALENCNSDDIVTISPYAASQPKVHLGMRAGQRFVLKDLFYSLMLESHNDSAVAIAEYIGGKNLMLSEAKERTKDESRQAVKAFIEMMNDKARDIGCFDTYFITPNGLDATVLLDDGEQKKHSTTAANLASILMYCITTSAKKDTFLEITQAASHSFKDVEGNDSYSCNNHNSFLHMMDGALTGKTGFTSEAGYCYVGAVEKDGKLLIAALLACGWPNNKTYKWSDMKKLMEYGFSNYEYREVDINSRDLKRIPVEKGLAAAGEQPYVELDMDMAGDTPYYVLLKESEQADISCQLPKSIKAPVEAGSIVGNVNCSVSGEVIAVFPVYAKNSVEKNSYVKCLKEVGLKFLGN